MQKGVQQLLIVCVFVAVLWIATGMDPMELAQSVVSGLDDLATRGPKITHSTPSTSEIRDGAPVNETPEELAAEATAWYASYTGDTSTEIGIEAYTIARVIRSERSSGGTNLEALIIGWVLKNDANKNFGGNVLKAATAPRGTYGRQKGVRFATTIDPYKSDLLIALAVWSGEEPDPTGGACNFMHPKGFKTPADYAEVKARWIKNGKTPVTFADAPQIEVYV
jgi:hypothetical protein